MDFEEGYVVRRSLIALFVGALTAMGLAIIANPAGTATPDAPPDAVPAAETVNCYSIPTPTGAALELCDHGPDNPPDLALGLPLDSYPPLVPQATAGIECYGDGVSGMRVQVVYVRPPGVTPTGGVDARLAEIRTLAAQVETDVSMSAQQTGGARHVRWVTNATCDLDILQVELASAAETDASKVFPMNQAEMVSVGHYRSDRIYLMLFESNVLCGIGNLKTVDIPSSMNPNSYGARYSRVDYPCWGSATTHELGHNVGAVQLSAPHSNGAGHCTDEWDLMCYVDESGVQTTVVCASFPNNRLYDCNNDDYFHTNPAPGGYLATHWNTANHPVIAANPGTPTPGTGTAGAGAYHSLTRPVRIVDTRESPPGSIWDLGSVTDVPTTPSRTTFRPGRLAPGRSYVSKITGFDAGPTGIVTFPQEPLVSESGVPNVGVAAVVLNITVVGAQSGGFLSIRPYDLDTYRSAQLNSNINYSAGQVIPNTVTITVPVHGLVEVFASAGSPFVIFDIAGWFADASGTFVDKGAYHALSPKRIMNTRDGLGGSTKLGPNTTVNLAVTGADVNATHAAAVVLNVTAAETTAASYFTVWPKGQAQPNASNVNFPAGAAAANLVVVGVGDDGSISIYLDAGTANVIVDLLGWFDGGGPGAPAGAVYRAITPTRLVDTRTAQPPMLAPTETRSFVLRGLGTVPDSPQVTAVIGNVTAVVPTGGGYLTTFPSGTTQPDTSTVNFVPAQDRANLSFLTLGSNGHSSVYVFGGSAHVLIDVAGYFTTS